MLLLELYCSVDEFWQQFAPWWQRQAAFLVATNVLDPAALADQDLIRTYKDQQSVERGFSFLKTNSSSRQIGRRCAGSFNASKA